MLMSSVLTSLASLQQGNVKKSGKLMKIVNIEEEKGSTLSLKNTILEKPQEVSNRPSHLAFLPAALFRVKKVSEKIF